MKMLRRKNNLLKFSTFFVLATTIILALVYYYIITKGILADKSSISELKSEFKTDKLTKIFDQKFLQGVKDITSQKDILKWASKNPWKFLPQTTSASNIEILNNPKAYNSIDISSFSIPIFKAAIYLSLISIPLLIIHLSVKSTSKKEFFITVFSISVIISTIILILFAISLSQSMEINNQIKVREKAYSTSQQELIDKIYSQIEKQHKGNTDIHNAIMKWHKSMRELMHKFKINSKDPKIITGFNTALAELKKVLQPAKEFVVVSITPK